MGMKPRGPPGETVPKHAPPVLRAVSNGNAPGSGMRMYIPKSVVQDLRLQSGTFYRLTRTPDGIHATPVDYRIREAIRTSTELPGSRIRLELSEQEATELEAYIALGTTANRSLILDLGKRLRRRMRLIGWSTPDRTDDKLSGKASHVHDIEKALAEAAT